MWVRFWGVRDQTSTSLVEFNQMSTTTLMVLALAPKTNTHLQRRQLVASAAAAATFITLLPIAPNRATAVDDEAAILDEIRAIRKALDPPAINKLLDEEQWDAVRSIFKVPPVNYAWEQSQKTKNPFKKLADLRDDVELFEVVDDLAASLQLADQYCYSNTFIYTQPGNGKVKIKEPKAQVKIAVEKIDSFL